MHGRIRQSLISEIGCRRLHAIDMRAVTWTYPFHMIYSDHSSPLRSYAALAARLLAILWCPKPLRERRFILGTSK